MQESSEKPGYLPRRRRRRRSPPGPVRFLVRLLSCALILSLVLVFLPRLTRLAGRLWPDPSRTTRVSQILSHEMKSTARLEMITVDDRGVLTSSVEAALIGKVQEVTIEYTYHASIGINLEEVELTANGSTLTLKLPPLEILSDDLTPVHVDRWDFWYPLTESRRSQLIAEERAGRAKAALAEANESEELRQKTVHHLEKMIQNWIGADTWLITIVIESTDPTAAS